MDKKVLMKKFILLLQKHKLLTLFIKNLFDYDNFYDYNYIFRMIEEDDCIIIDIYDNVSENRFNRYVFVFNTGPYDVRVVENNNVFITKIYIDSIIKHRNKLLMFAYMFKLDDEEITKYAETFLDKKIVLLLGKIINKPICI